MPAWKRGYEHYTPTARDRKLVQELVLLGRTEAQIAPYIGPKGVAVSTLRTHYAYEIGKYRDEMLGKVSATVYQMALGGNLTAATFILKCRGGWSESNALALSGKLEIVKRVIGVSEKDLAGNKEPPGIADPI